MASLCAACAQPLAGGRFCPHCGAPVVADAASADPLVGRTLGPYKVLRAVAEGGMGRIYLAEQTSLRRKVCVKTLRPDSIDDARGLARFEREARAVSALRHPNVVQVYDFGRDGDAFYLVMEWVEGRTLRALMEEDAPLSLERTCDLMTQVLSAIEEAHANGIIHRDLKPENVLVTRLRDGSDLARVVDFGIARVVDAERREGHLTGTGLVCGTPGYMSPEQITGDNPDARTDVYAAGVVMFELLTGKMPFAAPDLTELLRLHLTTDPPRPSRVTSLPIPPAVDQLLLRVLARERQQRLATALEFKRAVEALRPSRQAAGPVSDATTATCPTCGFENAVTQKFCGGCGAGLGPPSDDAGLLARVLPGDLAAHLGRLPAALSAERRALTVLHGRVGGFDGPGLSADAARQLTTRCFNGLVEAAGRHGGAVDRLLDDALVVHFGAAGPDEDGPERAVRCALDMQSFVTSLASTMKQSLELRVGLALGEVLMGGGRVDAGASAPLREAAANLASGGATGQVVVDDAVRRATAHAVRYRVDGGAAAGRSTVEGLGAPAQEQPLVGHAAALAQFDELLAQARTGRPGGVLFVAEAGLGKSRLLEAFAERARGQGLAVAQARSRRSSGAGQLEVLRELFLSLASAAPAGADVDARLESLTANGVKAGDVKRLRALLGTAPALTGHDAEERRRLDAVAVVQAFKDIAWRARGLVVVVDDAHLVDSTTAELLAQLVAQAEKMPLAVVASARPDAPLRGFERLSRRPLEPLSAPEVKALLEQQLSGPLPAEAIDAVLERSQGNAFIAREMTRAMVEAGALTLQGGRWRTDAAKTKQTLPLNVAQLYSARLDAASPMARKLLRCGALFGPVFPVELVAGALEVQPRDLQAAVLECTRLGFLEHVESPPGCVAFKAELLLRTVAQRVDAAEARALHRAIGEALERGLSAGDAHPAEAMARHFEAAGHRRKASTYFSAAAERLVRRNAFAAATESYLRAIRLVESELTASGEADAAAWGHYLELAAKAAATQGVVSAQAGLALVDEALSRAPAQTPPRLRGECLRQRGSMLLKLGRPMEAEAALNQAVEALGDTMLPGDRAAVDLDLSQAREARGDFGPATLLLVDTLKRVAGARLNDRDVLWRTLNQLGRLHLKTKQTARALEFFENALTHARQVRSAVGETRVRCNLAAALVATGDPDGAQRHLLAALELANAAHDRIDVARIEFNLGQLAAGRGHTAEAKAHLETAARLSNQVAWREGLAAATAALSSLVTKP